METKCWKKKKFPQWLPSSAYLELFPRISTTHFFNYQFAKFTLNMQINMRPDCKFIQLFLPWHFAWEEVFSFTYLKILIVHEVIGMCCPNFSVMQILIFCWLCISIYLFLNINQLDVLNLIISLFQASTCFEHMCSLSGGQNCIIQSLVSSHLQVAVPCTDLCSCIVVALIENYSTSKPLQGPLEKSQILICDSAVANEPYDAKEIIVL